MTKIDDVNRLLGSVKKNILLKPKAEFKLTGLTLTHQKKRKKRAIVLSLISLFTILSVVLTWFLYNLTPINSKSSEAVIVKIETGTTQSEIAKTLESKALIRSSLVFNLFIQLSARTNELKAGTYKLFKSDSLPTIVDKIVSGKGSEISIMILPGSNLMENRKTLLKYGFSDSEINYAYQYQFNHELLKTKPPKNDIEGFLYGETYNFSAETSLLNIFNKFFDHLLADIKKYDLENNFKKQGLNLYEAIILASIVQKEIISPVGSTTPSIDQRTVAGIFYNRLRSGMTLGSDVTYQYIADKLGLARDPKLDNPYNTRRYAGLPPGPVSSPGLTALLAVASPIDTEYLYFLSGDDGVTRYAKNDSEHQSNIKNYCKIACSKL